MEDPEDVLDEELDSAISESKSQKGSKMGFLKALFVASLFLLLFGGLILSPAIVFFVSGFEFAVVTGFVVVSFLLYLSL